MFIDYKNLKVVSSILGVSHEIAQDVLLFEELFFRSNDWRLLTDKEYSLGNYSDTREYWSRISNYFLVLKYRNVKTNL